MEARYVAVGVAALLIVGLVLLGSPRPPAFEALQWDSIPEGRAFREIFEISSVRGNLSSPQVTFVLNGAAVNATWTDAGTLHAGQRFYVLAEAFDAPHELEAFWDGKSVWRVTFTGGSGTPVR